MIVTSSEDDPKILKLEYLKNHFLGLTQIEKLGICVKLSTKPIITNASNEEDLQRRKNSKVEYLCSLCFDFI